jgi:hypothetical protein
LVEAKRALDETSPQLVYHGGPLLTSVEVFNIFWGNDWNNDDRMKDLPSKIEEFFKFIVASKLIDQLDEFSVNGKQIGHGRFIGTTKITTSAPPTTVDDLTVEDFLRNNIKSNTIPSPTDNTLYFVYLPSGISSSLPNPSGGFDLSCEVFCGYHGFCKLNVGDNSSKKIYYSVMPFPDCPGCHVEEPTDFDSLTVTSSHELVEAITDPEISATTKGTGWFVDNLDGSGGPEIGDLCNTTRGRIGGFLVQQEWSNKKGCILAT